MNATACVVSTQGIVNANVTTYMNTMNQDEMSLAVSNKRLMEDTSPRFNELQQAQSADKTIISRV